jgi:hypothetical protein
MSARAPEVKPCPEGKRAYRPPRLVLYGSVVELTRASLSKAGANDGLGGMGVMGMGFFKSG